MRTVAIVGFNAACNSEAFNLPDDVELWSVNHAHQFNFIRLNAVIEIHPLEEIHDPNFLKEFRKEYLAWLGEPHDFPIYMQDHYPEFPASVKYPLEEALALTNGRKYFASSFCYLAALTILKGDVGRVEVYGFTMANDTEWSYQRDLAYYWRAKMEDAGIDVYVTPDSDLFGDRKLYGYEGAQMVNRQTIEAHLARYKEQYKLNRVKCNVLQGQLIERAKHNGTQKDAREIQAMAETLTGFEFTTAKSEAAIEVCENFIEECDMKEVEPNLSAFERSPL